MWGASMNYGVSLFFVANVSGLGGDLVGKREPGAWEKLCLCKILRKERT